MYSAKFIISMWSNALYNKLIKKISKETTGTMIDYKMRTNLFNNKLKSDKKSIYTWYIYIYIYIYIYNI